MTFIEAVQSGFRRYVDFGGRASRSEFWWFHLFGFLCVLVTWNMGDFVGTIVALVLLLPDLAVTVRRLHDVGKSGWWFLIIFIPLVNLLLLLYFVMPSADGPNDWGETAHPA